MFVNQIKVKLKKDCWEILGIKKTKDVFIIRKTYRELIKKYHPDTVQAPERIRKYTIKCVEINLAYEEAMKYAGTHYSDSNASIFEEDYTKVKLTGSKSSHTTFNKVFKLFYTLFYIFIVSAIFIEGLHIYPLLSKTVIP